MMKAKLLFALIALAVVSSCSLYRNDRQFVWDSEYRKVRNLYDRCGSIALVKQILREHGWTRGQINEVVYRLSQDYWLDESGVPRGIERPQPVVPAPRRRVKMGLGPAARD